MGLFFTFKHRDPKVNIRDLFDRTHPFFSLDDLSFNKPWFQSGTWATVREALRMGLVVNNWFPGQPPTVDPSILLPAHEGRLFA